MDKKNNRKLEGKKVKHEIANNKTPNKKSNVKKDKKIKNENKKGKKALKIILSILLIFIIIIGVIFGRYIYKSGGNIKNAVINMVKDVMGEQDPIFVLVMGVSEDISAELTDTIMLAGYNPETNQAFVLSIPRDTFVGSNEASAGGFDKINALYQKSPQKTVEAVENLTGIKIDYYVTVKTSALVEIVDAIDGVEFDVPINMDYDDSSQDLHIHLKKGMQLLNGNQAEQLVRFRHNNNGTTYSSEYGDNDEGRMRTQREFLKAAASQVISWNNVDKLKEITTAVFKNLETDITLSKVLGYIPYIADFNIENLSMEQLPGTPAKLNDLWFYKADSEETKTLINGYIERLGLTESEKSKHLKKDTTKSNTSTKKNNKNTNNTSNNKNTTNTTKKQETNTTKKNAINRQNTTSESKNNTNTTNSVNRNKVNETKNNIKNNNVVTNEVKNEIKNEVKNEIKNQTSHNNTTTEKPAEKPETPSDTDNGAEKHPVE